jgi:hypothetical protein
VEVLPDPQLLENKKQDQGLKTFQLTPALHDEPFQAVQATSNVVPWRYIVLRPLKTITYAANQQNVFLIVLAVIIALSAAVVGLMVGRTMTRPILKSVAALTRSSEMLKKLSGREEVTANEQKWIVESSHNGLKEVKYYMGANGIAVRKLHDLGKELIQHLNGSDLYAIQQQLYSMLTITDYIEKATTCQEQSSKSLATAIRITTQVTEQLVSGATSAAHASEQLEDVIVELRQIIGE